MRTHRLLFIALCLSLLAGCREDPIRTNQKTPKDPPPVEQVDLPKVEWTLPPNWQRLPPSQRRFAVFQVTKDNPPLIVSVMAMPMPMVGGQPHLGQAAFELADMWKEQVGYSKDDKIELGNVAQQASFPAGEAALIDMSNPRPATTQPSRRIVGAVLPAMGRAWVFKMDGPSNQIESHKLAFLALVRSTKFPEQTASSGTAVAPHPMQNVAPPPPVAGASGIPGIAAIALPQGWKVDPQPRQMREGTILVPAGDSPIQVPISKLNATNFGSLRDNINRWRGMVGLQPDFDVSNQKPKVVETPQGKISIYDFEGPAEAGNQRKRMLLAMTDFAVGGSVWFFRLLGPHEAVTANRSAFEGMIQSIRFENP